MGKKILMVGLLLLMALLFSGCLERDECPSNYNVVKTDRIRCFYTHEESTTISAANDLTFGFACSATTLNCRPEIVTVEVDCPNACIQSYSGGI